MLCSKFGPHNKLTCKKMQSTTLVRSTRPFNQMEKLATIVTITVHTHTLVELSLLLATTVANSPYTHLGGAELVASDNSG